MFDKARSQRHAHEIASLASLDGNAPLVRSLLLRISMLRRIQTICRLVIACAVLACAATARADVTKVAPTAVVATAGATDAAWPLAIAIYASPLLRPSSHDVDDKRARVLAGEPPADESADLRELAESRVAVRGDDAASRQVLTAIATKLHLDALVVVVAGRPPTARVFRTLSGKFEAAHYEPDRWSTPTAATWDSAADSIVHALTVVHTPPVLQATEKPIVPTKTPKAFYESPWFWVAVGVGALAGGGVLIATNIQTSDAVHLQMTLP